MYQFKPGKLLNCALGLVVSQNYTMHYGSIYWEIECHHPCLKLNILSFDTKHVYTLNNV